MTQSVRDSQGKSIEHFFLNSLLTVGVVGILIVLATDLLFNFSDSLSIGLDCLFLVTFGIAGLLRKNYPTGSVLIVVIIASLSMIYQSLTVPLNTTTSLSIILVVGFIISVMLRGKLMWFMHGVSFTSLCIILIEQFRNPDLRFSPSDGYILRAAATFSTLYFVLNYATVVLKRKYDRSNQNLEKLFMELQERNNEIAAQNEQLLQTQDNLNDLNLHLEKKVNERAEKILLQNEILKRYSYTNAHHLRGPVARLLGLANVYSLDVTSNPAFFIEKMKEEAENIDSVVKKINSDLAPLE
jgi:hypothetical protein